jgi:hypothetical protein
MFSEIFPADLVFYFPQISRIYAEMLQRMLGHSPSQGFPQISQIYAELLQRMRGHSPSQGFPQISQIYAELLQRMLRHPPSAFAEYICANLRDLREIKHEISGK